MSKIKSPKTQKSTKLSPKQPSKPPFADLPDLLLAEILRRLDAKAKIRCERVCRRWRLICIERCWGRVKKFDMSEECIFCRGKACLKQLAHVRNVFGCLTMRCHLTHLKLIRAGIPVSYLSRICKSLVSLILQGGFFLIESREENFSGMLQDMPKLEALHVSDNPGFRVVTSQTSVKVNWDACGNLKNLRVLSFHEVSLCSEDLVRILPPLTSLIKLRLTVSCYCARCPVSLLPAFETLKPLEVLIFEHNYPRGRISAQLAKMIAKSSPSLIVLWLAQVDFGNGPFSELCESLANLKFLGIVGAPQIRNDGVNRIDSFLAAATPRRDKLTMYVCGTEVSHSQNLTNIEFREGFPSAVCDHFWDIPIEP